MEVIVKTTYNGKEEKECIENVISIIPFRDLVAVSSKDQNGNGKTQYIALDGYTDLIVR